MLAAGRQPFCIRFRFVETVGREPGKAVCSRQVVSPWVDQSLYKTTIRPSNLSFPIPISTTSPY